MGQNQHGRYILDGSGNPVAEPDLLTWGRWLETADRHVGHDIIGEVRVSTVFLGLDHSFGGDVPILFETMIFGGRHDQYQTRYPTREEALAGHGRALALVEMTDSVDAAVKVWDVFSSLP